MAFGHRHDRLTTFALLGVFAFFAVWTFRTYRLQSGALECLATLAGGKRPEGACPVSGKPYPADGAVRCPDPAAHLPTDPRFEAGRPAQAFPPDPAPGGFPIAGPHRAARTETSPSTAVVRIEPRGWWKYLVAPAIQVGLLAALVFLGRLLVRELRKPARSRPLLVVAGAAFLLVLLPTWAVTASIWGREAWTFDGASGTVTRRIFLADWERSTETWSGVRGLVPVRGASTQVMLLPAEGRPLRLFPIRDDGVGALAPLHRALGGR